LSAYYCTPPLTF
nr:immunoglobulin light chain junction region [Macaca mulatta]